jgi:hypothetical protein
VGRRWRRIVTGSGRVKLAEALGNAEQAIAQSIERSDR